MAKKFDAPAELRDRSDKWIFSGFLLVLVGFILVFSWIPGIYFIWIGYKGSKYSRRVLKPDADGHEYKCGECDVLFEEADESGYFKAPCGHIPDRYWFRTES